MIVLRAKPRDRIEAGVNVRGVSVKYQKKTASPAFVTSEGNPIYETVSKNSRAYVPGRSIGWQHPWKTTVDYYGKDGALRDINGNKIKGWGCRIKAGFVAGIDPIVRGAPDNDYGLNPEMPTTTAAQRMRAKIKEKPGLAENPLIPCISPQLLEKDSEIPVQLRDMGATGTKQSNTSTRGSALKGSATTTAQGVVGERSGNRYVAVQHFHIAVARPTHSLNVNFGTLNLVMGTGISYEVGFNSQTMDLFGVRARLNHGMPEKAAPPSLEERLSGSYQDPGEDYFPISSIYWLSPEDEEGGGLKKDGRGTPILDSAWTPFIRHYAFWNLDYRMKIEVPKQNPAAGILDPFLAMFIGRYTFAPAATLAAQESETNRIMAAVLNRTLPAGRFWTI